MDKRFDILWVGGSNFHGEGFEIPCIGGLIYHWKGGLIYHG